MNPSVDLTTDPLAALQRSVYETLSEALDVAVYDYVPESAGLPGKPTKPYVTISSGWALSVDTNNCIRWDIGLSLSVWSRYRGFLEANTIAGQVVAALHYRRLDVVGFGAVSIWVDRRDSLRDTDPEIRRVSLTCGALMEPERTQPEPEEEP